MDKSDKTHQIISVLMKEARHSMDHEHFEDAVIKLQRCLQLEDEPESRTNILNDLSYCFLKLGSFEEAVKIYTQLHNDHFSLELNSVYPRPRVHKNCRWARFDFLLTSNYKILYNLCYICGDFKKYA